MKLIDKEALLLALRKKRYSKQSLDLIESQPVVDAIPVDWVRKQVMEYKGDVDIVYDSDLLVMLERWRKENETR